MRNAGVGCRRCRELLSPWEGGRGGDTLIGHILHWQSVLLHEATSPNLLHGVHAGLTDALNATVACAARAAAAAIVSCR